MASTKRNIVCGGWRCGLAIRVWLPLEALGLWLGVPKPGSVMQYSGCGSRRVSNSKSSLTSLVHGKSRIQVCCGKSYSQQPLRYRPPLSVAFYTINANVKLVFPLSSCCRIWLLFLFEQRPVIHESTPK